VRRRFNLGFTLAELLIALGILGVIATFTIPKVLMAQQSGRDNAIAKEAAGMLSGAFQAYQQRNSVTANTRTIDLTQYMNYVAVQTSGSVDLNQADSTISCDPGTTMCLKLHSGAVLHMFTIQFSGTASTNALFFYLDPDGVEQSTTDGPGKSVVFFLYPNGRLTNYGGVLAGTQSSAGPHNACTACDPPWFSWN
jgi:prepilin-type N-terminal cleavage/methylation domain-containing protein